jgi:hypothetical protein
MYSMLQEDITLDWKQFSKSCVEISSCSAIVKKLVLFSEDTQTFFAWSIKGLSKYLDKFTKTKHICLIWETNLKNLTCHASEETSSRNVMQVQWHPTEIRDAKHLEFMETQCCITTEVLCRDMKSESLRTIENASNHLRKIMTTNEENFCETNFQQERTIRLSACYLYDQNMEISQMRCKAQLVLNEEEAMRMTRQIVWNVCSEMMRMKFTCQGDDKLKWIMLAECVRYAVLDWQKRTNHRLSSNHIQEHLAVTRKKQRS